MPTDVLSALEARRSAEKRRRANEALAAAILPLMACILVIILVLEWPSFGYAVALSGVLE